MACGFFQLKRNIHSTTVFPWNWTFTSIFFHRNLQHLVPNKPSFNFYILSWSSWHLQAGNVELQTFKLNEVGSKQKMCIPLPTSGGLHWWWRQNCSDEALKMINPVSLTEIRIYTQTTIFFMCSHLEIPRGFLLKVENTSLNIKELKHFTLTTTFNQNHLNQKSFIL